MRSDERKDADISNDKRPTLAAPLYPTQGYLISGIIKPEFFPALSVSMQRPIRTGGNVLGIKYMLSSKTYRTEVIGQLSDPFLKDYWTNEYAAMPVKLREERSLSTYNKIGQFILSPTLRNLLGQKDTIDFKDIMDTNKILLVSLPVHSLGARKVRLLGTLLLARLMVTGMDREYPLPFHLFIDEAHLVAPQIPDLLTNLPKFKVSLTFGNQYLAAFEERERTAILNTVGSIVAFRTGLEDAETLKGQFEFRRDDTPLQSLPPYHAFVRASKPFGDHRNTAMLSMPETSRPLHSSSPAKIRSRSKEYASPRASVERTLQKFLDTV